MTHCHSMVVVAEEPTSRTAFLCLLPRLAGSPVSAFVLLSAHSYGLGGETFFAALVALGFALFAFGLALLTAFLACCLVSELGEPVLLAGHIDWCVGGHELAGVLALGENSGFTRFAIRLVDSFLCELFPALVTQVVVSRSGRHTAYIDAEHLLPPFSFSGFFSVVGIIIFWKRSWSIFLSRQKT